MQTHATMAASLPCTLQVPSGISAAQLSDRGWRVPGTCPCSPACYLETRPLTLTCHQQLGFSSSAGGGVRGVGQGGRPESETPFILLYGLILQRSLGGSTYFSVRLYSLPTPESPVPTVSSRWPCLPLHSHTWTCRSACVCTCTITHTQESKDFQNVLTDRNPVLCVITHVFLSWFFICTITETKEEN